MRILLNLVAALLLGFALPAHAHKASDAYLQLSDSDQGITLRVDLALRDLDLVLDVDADGDGRIVWGEVRRAWPAIDAYLLRHVQVAGCELQVGTRALERRSDGAYAAVTLTSPCRPAGEPAIGYSVLGDVDPTHRGVARIELGSAAPVVRLLDPTMPAADAAAARQPTSFFGEGIHHILTGYDHVLFLLCLLLPSVMRRTPRGWEPVERLRDALLPVVAIVTAFTVAHSITLALAALQWVALPSSFIEPAIAVTIVLAAVDNLRPIFFGRRGLVTFLFGLVHGFGFAGVLGELDLPGGEFAWALLRFNLGLEFGQLLIVLAAAAVLFGMRRRSGYPAWAIRGGSLAAIAVGVLWFVERTADLSVLPL